jgi:hypothetical protein
MIEEPLVVAATTDNRNALTSLTSTPAEIARSQRLTAQKCQL